MGGGGGGGGELRDVGGGIKGARVGGGRGREREEEGAERGWRNGGRREGSTDEEKGREADRQEKWQMSLKSLCVCVTGSMESWKASCREG